MTVAENIRVLKDEELQPDTIKQLLQHNGKALLLPYKNEGFVFIEHATQEHYPFGIITSINIGFVDSEAATPLVESFNKQKYNLTSCEFYLPEDKDVIIEEHLFKRLKSRFPQNRLNNGLYLDEIFVKQHNSIAFADHTYYLVMVIQEFFKRTLQKQMDTNMALGLIETNLRDFGNHKHLWTFNGLNFNQACLLFILAPKVHPQLRDSLFSAKWVIQRYNFYLPVIQETERHIIQTVYKLP